MARRFSTRGISKDRVYTYKIAARRVGVSEATFRKWPKSGLRVIAERRPFLVRGADLIEFLQRREAGRTVIVAKGQFYCLRCKAPRNPCEGSVTYSATTVLTGRLSGVCAVCGGKVGQFCSAANVTDFVAAPAAGSNADSRA